MGVNAGVIIDVGVKVDMGVEVVTVGNSSETGNGAEVQAETIRTITRGKIKVRIVSFH